jgi:hypothetical protein
MKEIEYASNTTKEERIQIAKYYRQRNKKKKPLCK